MTTYATKSVVIAKLDKIRNELNKISKNSWCGRYQNLMDDLDSLHWAIDNLSNYSPWPQEFTNRFTDISKTAIRLSVITG